MMVVERDEHSLKEFNEHANEAALMLCDGFLASVQFHP
jgi:hypothetical protein